MTGTEEAREAALGFVIEKRAGIDCIVEDGIGVRLGAGIRPATNYEVALWDALQSVRAAGVREGIRQARSAVAAEALVDDTDDEFDVVYQSAIEDALAAIDALEADHD
jgi:hypothetical protein